MLKPRFGILVPWMNRTVEDELPGLVGNAAHLHWSRLLPDPLPRDRWDESYLAALLLDVPNAVARLGPADLRGIILACTSSSLEGAPARLGSETAVMTAFQCLLAELDRRSPESLLLCTPYSSRVTKTMAVALEAAGYRVEATAMVDSALEYRDIPAGTIVDAIASRITKKVDCVVVSCTALYTASIPAMFEARYGTSVSMVTSISSIAAHILGVACEQSVEARS